MRTIVFILQKEFLQIKRNKTMLPILFVVPFIQLFILVHAATFEMKHIRVHVIDKDMSTVSRNLISKFSGSPFYEIRNASFSDKEGEEDIRKNKADLEIIIPEQFEKKLRNEKSAKIQLVVNAINSAAAGLVYAYTSAIILDYDRSIIAEWTNLPSNVQASSIPVTSSYWYNPELNYKNYMVPGILVLLVTLIGMFLTGMNIVREKELGTIEQINITPIKKYQFIVGKLLPFWIIGQFELAFGLCIGKLLFNIPMLGNLGIIFLFSSIYLCVVLGAGLVVSTINNTQQQSMFISFFFMMIFIMMSGLFTPVDSMPGWAQKINIINPVAYFIQVMRMVLIKGSGLMDVMRQLVSITVFAVFMLSFAVWRYRKVS
jgi:ABC-2 type transport system permease protein